MTTLPSGVKPRTEFSELQSLPNRVSRIFDRSGAVIIPELPAKSTRSVKFPSDPYFQMVPSIRRFVPSADQSTSFKLLPSEMSGGDCVYTSLNSLSPGPARNRREVFSQEGSLSEGSSLGRKAMASTST